jgi:hypothetical protein
VLVFGSFIISVLSYLTISSISQTGVTWSRAKQSQLIDGLGNYYNIEIWTGNVGSGASPGITLTLNISGTPTTVNAIVDVCEYAIPFPSIDQTASNSGQSTTSDTGTTATTSTAYELCVGGTFSWNDTNQTSPTNGFNLLDGALFQGITSLSMLEKFVSSIGTANSGTSLGTYSYWVGCVITIEDQSWASVGGYQPSYCIPVTLTNSQSSATLANFQVKVTINSNTNSSDYASNLANVNWQDGSGNILSSWLESGETNTSTASVYWVNLGSKTIAASGGTLTIYQVIYPTSVNCMNTSNTGAEPNYTGTYGQYDNGASVFGFYDNFAGTSLNSKWTKTSYCSATVNNGLTLQSSCSSGGWGGMYASYSTSNPVTMEANAEEATTSTSALALQLAQSSTYVYSGWCEDSSYMFYYDDGSHNTLIEKVSSSNAGTQLVSSTWSSKGTYYILSAVVGSNATNNLAQQVGYGSTFSQTVGDTTYTSFSYVCLNVYYGGNWKLYWVRCRITPPSLTMPSASAGSVTTITTYITITETGSGSDSIASLQYGIAVSDAGSGVDSASVTGQIPISDAGFGSDSISISGQATPINVSDSGSGSDSLAITAQASLSDSGSGSDSVAIQNNVPLSDSGSGSDSIVLQGQISVTDSGSGSDSVSVPQIGVSLTDSGSGSDSIASLQANVPVSDSGSGSDTVNIQNSLGVTDSGAGSDSASVTQITPVSVSDSGQGSDSISSIQAQIPIADSGQGADSVSLQAQVPLSDSCSGSDSVVAGSQVNISDSGSGSASLTVQPKIPVSDSGQGSDSLSIQAQVPLADSGQGTDAAQVTLYQSVSDIGSGSDTVSTSQFLALSDSGVGSDATQVQASLAIQDSCHGTDIISLSVPGAVIAISLTLKSGEVPLVLKAVGQ